MLRLAEVFALFGVSLLICALLLTLLASWRGDAIRPIALKILTASCLLMLWIPVGNAQIPVVAYVRGLTGDLSITSIALAAWHIGRASFGFRVAPKRDFTAVMVAVAMAAVFLYPLALGWGDWDAYRPGWGSWGMLLTLLVLCAACSAQRLRLMPALIALALLAWAMGLMGSGNLWDYLIDPWLSIYALGFVFIKCGRHFMSRFNLSK